ncbi:MAG TPA: hypothetical protein VKG43_12295 [Acidimicrobiales bacterium]|nr:hypothetical protein [Acidimicrobiales bacterium]
MDQAGDEQPGPLLSAATGSPGSAEEATPSAAEPGAPGPATAEPPKGHRARIATHVRGLVQAILHGDDAMVERAVLDLAGKRRWLAPLALVVGGFVMLFQGLKLLLTNWRLTLIQLLPAMWIWLAAYDLKQHALRGREFDVIYGPVLIVVVLAIATVTVAAFYLNAVFAFAIARPGKPDIRAGFGGAGQHVAVVVGWGFVIGIALGLATTVVDRYGRGWYVLAMTVVVGVMMYCYVAIPSRLIGVPARKASTRDKLAASAVAGTVGAVICSPPLLLTRLGILMLGWHGFFIPALFVLTLGVTVQAGATGAVKAVKMSAKLVGGATVQTPPVTPGAGG